jgi:hypothetical protein
MAMTYSAEGLTGCFSKQTEQVENDPGSEKFICRNDLKKQP